mgnify:CR=1 FL=1
MNTERYGVQYRWARNMSSPIVMKEKLFSTLKQQQAFAAKIEKADGFIEFVAWLAPANDGFTAQ